MNNSLKLKRHPEAIAEGSYEILHYVQNDESGRTLVEMLATLSIVGLLAWGVVRVYNGIVTRVKVQNTAKMIKTLALERQNTAMSDRVGLRTKVKGPHSDLFVENGKPGNHSKYFWVETTLKDESFCKGLRESELIGADLIEINDVINGACEDNSKLAFYFKKNTSSDENLIWVDGSGNVQKCPTGSSACDSSGNATACEEGYYLTMGECERCGEHVATCEDENMPTTCAEGYELHWGACILPPQMCTMDSDCDVCASCDTETGRCQGECKIPKNDCEDNDDCGKNECMVCNSQTQRCEYACTRVDYIISTGNQWIDTEIDPRKTTSALTVSAQMKFIKPFNGEADIAGSGNGQTATMGRAGRSYFLWAMSNTSWNPGYVDEAWHDIIYQFNKPSGRTFTLDGTPYTSTYTNSFSGEYETLWIFASSPNRYPLACQLKNIQITIDDHLKFDAIPVFAPDGEVCMFDRVRKKLFHNASRTPFDYNPK